MILIVPLPLAHFSQRVVWFLAAATLFVTIPPVDSTTSTAAIYLCSSLTLVIIQIHRQSTPPRPVPASPDALAGPFVSYHAAAVINTDEVEDIFGR